MKVQILLYGSSHYRIVPAVSHAHLETLDGYDHVHKSLQLPPTIERDVYCAEVMVQTGKSTALVCVHRGTCYVNGEEMREGEKPRRMKNGTILIYYFHKVHADMCMYSEYVSD